MGLIENNDSIYVIDLDKLMSFITDYKSNEKNNEKNIVHTYLNKGEDEITSMKLDNKTTTESVSTYNEAATSIRYDIIKNLINIIIQPMVGSQGELILIKDNDEFSFGQSLALNTLINAEIITDINKQ